MFQVPKKTKTSRFSAGLTRSQSSGPLSLNLSPASQFSPARPDLVPSQRLEFASSTLDTNLHKILARRMAGGQGVSYHSCKLLTKAYYKLLRDPASPGVVAPPPPSQPYTHNCAANSKLSWQSLVKTETKQVSGILYILFIYASSVKVSTWTENRLLTNPAPQILASNS